MSSGEGNNKGWSSTHKTANPIHNVARTKTQQFVQPWNRSHQLQTNSNVLVLLYYFHLTHSEAMYDFVTQTWFNRVLHSQRSSMSTHPLLSTSNILNATEKLDSGMLSSVTKNIYLLHRGGKKGYYGHKQTHMSCHNEIKIKEKVEKRTKLG